jgi:hypothetical protein
LREQGLASIHRYSPAGGIPQKYLKKQNLSSNRHQNKSSGKAYEYWISSKIRSIKPDSSDFFKTFNVTYPKNVDSGSILAISKGKEFRSSLPL